MCARDQAEIETSQAVKLAETADVVGVKDEPCDLGVGIVVAAAEVVKVQAAGDCRVRVAVGGHLTAVGRC